MEVFQDSVSSKRLVGLMEFLESSENTEQDKEPCVKIVDITPGELGGTSKNNLLFRIGVDIQTAKLTTPKNKAQKMRVAMLKVIEILSTAD